MIIKKLKLNTAAFTIASLTIALTPITAFSNSIYKCTDSNGSVSYMNNNDSSKNCIKTDLNNPNKLMVVENHSREAQRKRNNSIAIVESNLKQQQAKTEYENRQEVYLREQKRKTILSEELKSEQTQLETIKSMLNNVVDDEAQKLQLENMISTHQKNISTLQQQIGNINKQKAPTPPRANVQPAATQNIPDPEPILVAPEKQFVEVDTKPPVNVLNINPEVDKDFQVGYKSIWTKLVESVQKLSSDDKQDTTTGKPTSLPKN